MRETRLSGSEGGGVVYPTLPTPITFTLLPLRYFTRGQTPSSGLCECQQPRFTRDCYFCLSNLSRLSRAACISGACDVMVYPPSLASPWSLRIGPRTPFHNRFKKQCWLLIFRKPIAS